MILFQRIILQRLNQATADDLLKYSKQYGISLTRTQAIEVANLLYGKNVNIFNESERMRLLKQVEAITSKETARTVNELFKQFTS
ncbi:tRNA methyltransferase [Bacillus subtilis]|nr:tRNA methyltransferase [Bacillus subtilis]OBA07294.1 tRNA methyltransferase [Bacillus subtilis]